MRPSVSAIVAAHNLSQYLAEALDSVLVARDQGVDLEVIVVDDGSTDDFTRVIRPYEDRVRVIRTPNQGVAKAQNLGIREARGQYLELCDADDVQHPWRIPMHLRLLESYRDVALVFSDLETWVDGCVTAPSTLRDRPMGPSAMSFDDALHAAFDGTSARARDLALAVPERFADARVYRGRVPHLIAIRHVAWTAFSMMRREAVIAVGGYDPRMKRWQDWGLASKLSLAYPLAYVDVPVALYRQHATQLTKRAKLGAEMQAHVTKHVWQADPAFAAKHPAVLRELIHHVAIRLAHASVKEQAWADAKAPLLEAVKARPDRREGWTALARATVMDALGHLRA